jgi:hypothetical protein
MKKTYLTLMIVGFALICALAYMLYVLFKLMKLSQEMEDELNKKDAAVDADTTTAENGSPEVKLKTDHNAEAA